MPTRVNGNTINLDRFVGIITLTGKEALVINNFLSFINRDLIRQRALTITNMIRGPTRDRKFKANQVRFGQRLMDDTASTTTLRFRAKFNVFGNTNSCFREVGTIHTFVDRIGDDVGGAFHGKTLTVRRGLTSRFTGGDTIMAKIAAFSFSVGTFATDRGV